MLWGCLLETYCIQCNSCNLSFHTLCSRISADPNYSCLANSTSTWICPNCGLHNFSGFSALIGWFHFEYKQFLSATSSWSSIPPDIVSSDTLNQTLNIQTWNFVINIYVAFLLEFMLISVHYKFVSTQFFITLMMAVVTAKTVFQFSNLKHSKPLLNSPPCQP